MNSVILLKGKYLHGSVLLFTEKSLLLSTFKTVSNVMINDTMYDIEDRSRIQTIRETPLRIIPSKEIKITDQKTGWPRQRFRVYFCDGPLEGSCFIFSAVHRFFDIYLGIKIYYNTNEGCTNFMYKYEISYNEKEDLYIAYYVL